MTNTIPGEILDDLAGRFVTNLPDEERNDPVRLCFQVERAYWFYCDNLDFYSKDNKTLPKCNVREFIRQIFQQCSFLRRYVNDLDSILEQWRTFKNEIPTFGAILLDESMENVLLVQGYYARTSWGFPKGKANEEELPHNCAIREVQEETGFDISSLIDENEFLERHIADTLNRLYIVPGVPQNFQFKPTTRNEIKECRWFALDTLPTSRTDNTKADLGIYPSNFYMVCPYIEHLKKWVAHRRWKRNGRTRGNSTTTPGSTNGYNQQYGQEYRRANRSSPRIRNSSSSFSSPFTNISETNRHQSATTSDKAQKSQSSKQQKRNRKSSNCKQKLDFDNNLDNSATSSGSLGIITPSAIMQLVTSGGLSGVVQPAPPGVIQLTPQQVRVPVSVLFENLSTGQSPEKVVINPSVTWQQFKVDWEAILSNM